VRKSHLRTLLTSVVELCSLLISDEEHIVWSDSRQSQMNDIAPSEMDKAINITLNQFHHVEIKAFSHEFS
jgi:hypothetical protein